MFFTAFFVQNAIKTSVFSSKRRKNSCRLTLKNDGSIMGPEKYWRLFLMKSKYETPILEISPLSDEDIIKTSSGRSYVSEWDHEM